MAQARSQSTKTALIKAAFELFARNGFSGTSTREIAAAANTNIASITYHFGGKSGLRLACAEAIVEQMSQLQRDPDHLPLPPGIDVPQTTFETLILRQAYMLLRMEEAEMMISFLFREVQEKTEAFDHIYTVFFGPLLAYLVTHWIDAVNMTPAEIKDEKHNRQLKLTVFSIISQIAYFRIAKPVVARHMDWQGYTEKEAIEVICIIQRNIRAILDAHRSAS